MNKQWREYAACLGKAPLWDETIDDGGLVRERLETQTERHRKAREICAGCPVTEECWADQMPGRDEGIRNSKRLHPLFRNKEMRGRKAS